MLESATNLDLPARAAACRPAPGRCTVLHRSSGPQPRAISWRLGLARTVSVVNAIRAWVRATLFRNSCPRPAAALRCGGQQVVAVSLESNLKRAPAMHKQVILRDRGRKRCDKAANSGSEVDTSVGRRAPAGHTRPRVCSSCREPCRRRKGLRYL